MKSDVQRRIHKNDIYNADETSILYNATPQQTFKLKGENCIGGIHFKNRLTNLPCSILSGTDKNKLLVIASPENRWSFKNSKKLPID